MPHSGFMTQVRMGFFLFSKQIPQFSKKQVTSLLVNVVTHHFVMVRFVMSKTKLRKLFFHNEQSKSRGFKDFLF
jgi:hypothetical protein